MKIYNTLSGKKEEFIPISGTNKVNMYACGITVSGEAHIGHAFQALIYDIVKKYLEKSGYAVTYARNYTDVDDKIINKAQEANIPADAYAKMMIKKIDAVMKRFEVDDPDIWLKATENINNIIEFISELIEKGHAYATDSGSVYFSVESFPEYGRLSHRTIENMLDGVRIENDQEKKSALDFALWKAAKPNEIFWESPWGKGRPGWHIECSTMNKVAFGDSIDIHGGGRDLIFPHHENEIAQSEALTGKRFAKYWMHNGLIKVDGQKMSKSLNNFILLNDLLNKYSAESVKFAMLSNSYRNDVNLSDSLFMEAEKHLNGFYTLIQEASKYKFEGEDEEVENGFKRAMDDDFNTARALSDLFGYFKKVKSELSKGNNPSATVNSIINNYRLLGIFKSEAGEYLAKWKKEAEVPADLQAMAEKMQSARLEKNYALADSIRAEIFERGYNVKITANGVELIKNN